MKADADQHGSGVFGKVLPELGNEVGLPTPRLPSDEQADLVSGVTGLFKSELALVKDTLVKLRDVTRRQQDGVVGIVLQKWVLDSERDHGQLRCMIVVNQIIPSRT